MILLGGVATVSLALSVFLSVFKNPEVRFWSELLEKKDREIASISGQKIVFIGGSSCTFSVNPAIINEGNLPPAYNYGGSLFMGASYIFEKAKRHIHRDDILVVGFEPEILEGLDGSKSYPLGNRLCIYETDWKTGRRLSGEDRGLGEWTSVIRPGLRNMMVMAGRKIQGGRPYAYTMEDWQGGGRLELSKVEFVMPPRVENTALDLEPAGEAFLREISRWCEDEGVRCVYTIPWQGTQQQIVKEREAERRDFLEEISATMPVLPDPRAGVLTGMEGFADSEYHMGAELSAERSRFLRAALEAFLIKE